MRNITSTLLAAAKSLRGQPSVTAHMRDKRLRWSLLHWEDGSSRFRVIAQPLGGEREPQRAEHVARERADDVDAEPDRDPELRAAAGRREQPAAELALGRQRQRAALLGG